MPVGKLSEGGKMSFTKTNIHIQYLNVALIRFRIRKSTNSSKAIKTPDWTNILQA